ncbi:MAG: M13 family metallopeptidase [Pseudomonadota bacterium]
MKRAFLSTLALLSVLSCSREKAAPEAAKAHENPDAPQLGSFGVDMSAMDKSVDPGDDFYAYVNGEWLKTFKIPDEYSSYGSFTVLAERSEERLKSIVESIPATAAAGAAEQKVRDFYASYLGVDAINAKGLAPLAADFAAIEAMTTHEAIAAAFFDPALRAKSPVGVWIGVDAKRPDRYAVHLTQSGLGMPNRDYYLDEKFADKRTKYRDYIASVLTLAGLADAQGAADRVFAFELEIARTHWEPAKRRNRDLTYNLKSIEQLEAFAPSAPWRAMLASAGLQSLDEVIVREDDAVQKIADLVAATPVATLQEYLKFHLINSNADVLPSAFDDANFAFFGTELRGTLKQKERWKRATAALDGALGEAVGAIYVERHFPPQSKEAMNALVGNLRAALDERLDTLAWMSDETRAKAEEKLAKFTTKIGYPDKWRDYAALEIVAGDAYGNARRAQAFEWDFEASRLGGPVDRSEWGMTPQTVNAYYNPTLNEIVFPAAILEAPFFDRKADAAVNYGAIGAVIGHEIGHGFDDQGRKSDGDGVLADWWTPADAERFNERAGKLGAQYAAYEPIEGFAINPGLTMGENIGDLGGLAIAYHAYKLSLGGADAPVIDGLTGDQRFFLAWAQVWKRVVRDEQLKNQIASDPHSPAQFRVNGVVRNMDAWYEAFGVTADDDLWLEPEDRVQIW